MEKLKFFCKMIELLANLIIENFETIHKAVAFTANVIKIAESRFGATMFQFIKACTRPAGQASNAVLIDIGSHNNTWLERPVIEALERLIRLMTGGVGIGGGVVLLFGPRFQPMLVCLPCAAFMIIGGIYFRYYAVYQTKLES